MKSQELNNVWTRREFLRASTLAVIGGTFALSGKTWINPDWTREQSQLRQLPRAASKSPNVLVIVLDTVRFDRFAGSAQESLTPNLDRIAANGVRYENAWANSSWSLPSQASILTGRYPHEHGADWPSLWLRPEYPSLSEFFASRGYVTGAFSSNSAWVTPEYLGRGFLRFQVYTLEDHLRRTVHGRKLDRLSQELGYHYAGRGKKAPALNAQFLNFLNDYRDYPYFAYLCYMDVNQGFHNRKLNHGFWEAKPAVSEVVDAYDQALETLDGQIGELFAELELRGDLENTLIVITSDHGESFGATQTDDHDPEGHGTSLYPEQTRVPLFVVYPAHVPAGITVTRTVGLDAIPATITLLLGLAGSPFNSVPLPVTNQSESDGGIALSTLNYDDRKLHAVIRDQLFYLRDLGSPQQHEELYDLVADPLAKENLTGNQAALTSMQKLLQQLVVTRS